MREKTQIRMEDERNERDLAGFTSLDSLLSFGLLSLASSLMERQLYTEVAFLFLNLSPLMAGSTSRPVQLEFT